MLKLPDSKILFILGIILSPSAWSAQKSELSYCIDPNWYPLSYTDNGTHKGLSADLIKRIQNHSGLSFVLHNTNSWSESYSEILNGGCDVIFDIQSTEKRRKHLVFSDVIYKSELVFVTNKQERYITDPKAFVRNNRLGLVDEYGPSDSLNIQNASYYRSLKSGLIALFNNEIDAMVDSSEVMQYILMEEFPGFSINSGTGVYWELRAAVKKENASIIKEINPAIAAISTDELNQLRQKWFWYKEPKPEFQWLYQISPVLLLLCFAIYYFYSQGVRLKALSVKDELTSQLNRRGINKSLRLAYSLFLRANINFSIIIIDIDHFKVINDKHGHLEGDNVLKSLSQLLQHQLRNSDTLGRWGGEEFMIICFNTELNDAVAIAERLRATIEKDMKVDGKSLTASFGIADIESSPGAGIDNLIRVADERLYQAKMSGRNRCIPDLASCEA